MSGFLIDLLVVSGTNKSDAAVSFRDGCNIVIGPSNTGKSYVLECIDFMLGGAKRPEELTEGNGYQDAWLQITRRDDKTSYVLRRSLAGGGFRLYRGKYADISDDPGTVLGARHSEKKSDTISTFLLELSGYPPSKIRKNKYNELVSLSFRLIAHFFVVNETRIVAKQSPLAIEGGYEFTKVRSAFNYLLTGRDDSSLVSQPRDELQSAKINATRKVFEGLIEDLEKKISSAGGDSEELRKRLVENEDQIAAASASIGTYMSSLREAEEQRQLLWEAQQQTASRQIVIRELLSRFDLLEQQYRTDLQRLDFILEGSEIVERLESVNCPLCGLDMGQHLNNTQCVTETGEVIDIRAACRREAEKIAGHLYDLNSTMNGLRVEEAECKEAVGVLGAGLEAIDEELGSRLIPTIKHDQSQFDRLLSEQRQILERDLDRARLQQLLDAKIAAETKEESGDAADPVEVFDLIALNEFCDAVHDVLEEWSFPGLGTIYFDTRWEASDLVINGKRRQANGKGIRGISYAAFTIGLMRYCETEGLPHPKMLVIDSPLTTYKQGQVREVDDEVPTGVQAAFYQTVAAIEAGQQVIVIENKEPPSSVLSTVNLVRFDGLGGIRPGFFPV